MHIPADNTGRVSIPALLEHLATLEINSLMVEGGARVISTFLLANMVDWIILTIAPVLLGGLRAIAPDAFTTVSRTANPYPRLQEIGVERLGNDLIVWGSLNTNG